MSVLTIYKPINPKHPFWSASTGSSLKLSLKDDNHSLLITVHTTTQPYVYKVVNQEVNKETKSLYLKQKEILKHIKTEWWEKYGDQTIVEFMEQKKDSDTCYFESCPPTPSPRSIRRSTLKILLGSPIKDLSVNSLDLSQSPSPRTPDEDDQGEDDQGEDDQGEDDQGEEGTEQMSSSPTLLLKTASFHLQTNLSRTAIELFSATPPGTLPGTPTNSFNSELSPQRNEE